MEKLTIPTAEPFFFPGGKTGCVLVHGFTGSPKEMRLMGDYLNENGFSVIGIRLAPYTISNDWRSKLAKQISPFMPFVKKEQGDTIDQKTAKDHIDYPAYPTRSIAELNELVGTLHRNLDQIHIPVLFINSKNDKTVPPSHAENYRREIPSNHFELVTLENSGHVITEDIEREIVFNAARNFIRKYSKQ